MKTNPPTHEEITRLAHNIWTDRESPTGHDVAIWLEAERRLASEVHESPSHPAEETNTSFDPFDRNRADGSAKNASSEDAAPDPIEVAAKAATQKHAASAPRFPTRRSAPSIPVAPSGKPLWNKNHSS